MTMKKLLQVSAVLLAAVLMFAGCKNNADEGGDDLPGTWVSSLEYYDDWQKNNWTAQMYQLLVSRMVIQRLILQG